MSENNLLNYTPIAIILVGLLVLEFNLFQAWGIVISGGGWDIIDMLLFLSTLVILLLSIFTFILMMLTALKEDFKNLFEKLAVLITIIISILFAGQIITFIMMIFTS
ncbi:MAG: hypothetical protein ACFFBD_01030 [Candidatus Hodarchaeota archaeon]